MFKRSSQLLLAVLLFGISAWAVPVRIDSVQRLWIGNTGGTYKTSIQDKLTSIGLYYSGLAGELPNNPYVITTDNQNPSNPGTGYLVYTHGRYSGVLDTSNKVRLSDTVKSHGVSCWIVNRYGRFFRGHYGGVPSGASAPYVACSNSDTIKSVLDPTAIAFDTAGNLLVSDNGREQNVKIFNVKSVPILLRVFGDSGGVFLHSRTGAPVASAGESGVKRFSGIRGLAVDSQGNIYIASTGLPARLGGVDIRAFSGKDSSLLWKVQGLANNNSADFEPASNGSGVFTTNRRYYVDYTKAPGALINTATTLDPFLFPNDPRLSEDMESVFDRRIGGVRYQYHTDHANQYVYVTRFTGSSEIGIPMSWINIGSNPNWGIDSAPAWNRNEDSENRRWAWNDANANGYYQKSEFNTYNITGYPQGIDVDEVGDIWIGGTLNVSGTKYAPENSIVRIRAGAQSTNGFLRFRTDSLIKYNVTASAGQSIVGQLKHLSKTDVMFLAQGDESWKSSTIQKYMNFSDSTKRTKSCAIDLGLDDTALISNRDTLIKWIVPWSFTADSEYVYVTYMYNGKYTNAPGEITVYDARTCAPLGWFGPDSTVATVSKGSSPPSNSINVFVQTDGHRLITVSDAGSNKVLLYRMAAKPIPGMVPPPVVVVPPVTPPVVVPPVVPPVVVPPVVVPPVVVPPVVVPPVVAGASIVLFAEDYARYYDNSKGNYGDCPSAKANSDVDLQTANDSTFYPAKLCNAGWIDTGEYLEYDIRVDTAHTYQVSARIASALFGSKVTVLVDGAVVGTATILGTLGWQAWTNIDVGSVNLGVGVHVVRMRSEGGSPNFRAIILQQK